MRQQLFNLAVHVHRQPRQHIFQGRVRIVPGQLARLNQTHHCRCPLASSHQVLKQPVVTANRNRPNLFFDPVVVHGKLTALYESRQRFPVPQAVVNGFGRGRFFGYLLLLKARL